MYIYYLNLISYEDNYFNFQHYRDGFFYGIV